MLTTLDAIVGCQRRWIGPSVCKFLFALLNPKFRELCSSVGMATNYGLDGTDLNPNRAKRYCPLQKHPDQIFGPLKPFIQWVLGSFPKVKWPGPEVDYWPPSSAEVRNEWNCTYTTPVWIHGIDTDNFTLFITEFQVLMFVFHRKDLSIQILKAAFVSSNQDIV
jgi:hypothetical protein